MNPIDARAGFSFTVYLRLQPSDKHGLIPRKDHSKLSIFLKTRKLISINSRLLQKHFSHETVPLSIQISCVLSLSCHLLVLFSPFSPLLVDKHDKQGIILYTQAASTTVQSTLYKLASVSHLYIESSSGVAYSPIPPLPPHPVHCSIPYLLQYSLS